MKCLLASAAGILALAIAACSQTSEPDVAEEAVAAVVDEAKPEHTPRPGKSEKKVREKKSAGKKKVKDEPAAPEPAPAELPPPPLSLEAKPPAATPVELPSPFVPSAPGKRIAQLSVPGPYVAVTFDDGPSATLTPQVLDIFARHGARATFFVQGRNANRNRSILARAVAEGHEVGSHTWSHINMRASSREQILRELDRTADVIEEATGSRPKVMRPPYGAANQSLINMVYNRYGTPAILWDVDTNDWRKPGVQTVINRAVGKARPGSIILLHDIHPSTIEAVEGIVTGLQARGFKLVTVSELIAMARRAAGASAPAAEPENNTPAAAEEEQPLPAPATVPPAATPAPVPFYLPAGAAGIGAAPAEKTAEPAPAAPSMPADDDFNFYEEL